MSVPHSECTAFNCVLCHAWVPKEAGLTIDGLLNLDQPAGAIYPSADDPALYAISMINDLATSWRVRTLSNGLVDELTKAGLGIRIPRLSTLNQGGQSFQRIFG